MPPQLVDIYYCNAPPTPLGPGQQPAAGGGGGGGGGATPITQDFEQESESGEID